MKAPSQGVTCNRCGAGTPLPDDLRTPTFRCSRCGETLSTAAYAGQAAVSADEMRAHLMGVIADPRAAMQNAGNAPRFRTENAATRAARCVHCGGPVAVPLDLHAKTVDCAGCGRTQPISTYISDKDRFMTDMARQLAGNAELRQLRAEGVACPQCGANNPVPDDGAVQVPCRYCQAPILLAGFVASDAVARARLKHGLQDFRQAIDARTRKQARLNVIIVAVVFTVIAVATVGAIVAGIVTRGR